VCVCVCACACVRIMRVCVCKCMRAYTYTHKHMYTHILVYSSDLCVVTSLCIHLSIYLWVCCVCICMHLCMQRCKYFWMYTVSERAGAHLFTDGIPLVGKPVYKFWTCLHVLLCFVLWTLATALKSWERCFVLYCLCVYRTLSLLKII